LLDVQTQIQVPTNVLGEQIGFDPAANEWEVHRLHIPEDLPKSFTEAKKHWLS
jgi:hypothetical protein